MNAQDNEPQIRIPEIPASEVVKAMHYCGSIYRDMNSELEEMFSEANQQRYVKLTVEVTSLNPDNDRDYVDYIPVSEAEVTKLHSTEWSIAELMEWSKGRHCICIHPQGSDYYTSGFFNPFF